MFLFEGLPGGQWGALVGVLVGWFVAHRLLKQRRRREQLRRRRQIRARLHGTPPLVDDRPPAPIVDVPVFREIDLTEPGVEIDLRDGVVYGSEITLESGDTLETGAVGSLPPD